MIRDSNPFLEPEEAGRMSSVDLKIVLVVLVTLAAYTVVASVIPQVESEVPMDIAFGAEVTPEELVEAGESIYRGAGGCVACHSESPGARGPNLLTDYRGEGLIGERCADRVPGLDCKEYLYQALVRPNDHIVDDYPPIMPPSDRALSQPQIWAMVAFLQAAGGEVTVTAADIPDEPGAATAPAPPPAPEPGAAQLADAPDVFRAQCVMCHQVGGEGGPIGPPMDGIGARLSEAELRLAILDPEAVIAEGYEDMAGIMPPNYGEILTPDEIETLVRYLSGLH
ncbi:MAG: hypothetical protein EA421_05415 [Gemmatimonadales bacterium]|nr:MAG: hypothetical protein EA421_05415 [Gemmatimonadales bacterium]